MGNGDAPRDDTSIAADARSHGSVEGSARGRRNLVNRIQLMAELVPLRGHRLLDIGCGRGDYTIVLAEGFDEVDAIDVEPERLALLADSAPVGVRTHFMSGMDTTFADATFDMVTAIEVLEHVRDPTALFAEVSRILVPGGAFLLTTPNRLWPFEQHGVTVGRRHFSGLAMPGVTWIPALHRRVSDADAFTLSRIRRYASHAGLDVIGFRTMMPPLDSRPDGSFAHRALERASATALKHLAQTIIGGFRKPAEAR